MASSHAPFVLVNRTVNPLVRAVLASPAHRLLSGRLALIAVSGRRSGRVFTLPVGYHREGERVTITIDWPERKLWWRNLRGGAPVSLLLGGVRRTGVARVREDDGGVAVDVDLDPLGSSGG